MEFLAKLLRTLVGAVVGPQLQHYFERRRRSSEGPGSVHPWVYLIAALVGGGTVFLLGWLVVAPLASPPPPAGPHAIIDQPADGAKVPHAVKASGRVTGLEAGKVLWLLVLPLESPKYHPQPGPLVPAADGRWTSTVYVGTPGKVDDGKEFTLLLVEAGAEADARLRDYMDQVGKTQVYPGLGELPSGTIPLARLTLTRI
jgi:hypothetical protein